MSYPTLISKRAFEHLDSSLFQIQRLAVLVVFALKTEVEKRLTLTMTAAHVRTQNTDVRDKYRTYLYDD